MRGFSISWLLQYSYLLAMQFLPPGRKADRDTRCARPLVATKYTRAIVTLERVGGRRRASSDMGTEVFVRYSTTRLRRVRCTARRGALQITVMAITVVTPPILMRLHRDGPVGRCP
jgi:hypothetical protein